MHHSFVQSRPSPKKTTTTSRRSRNKSNDRIRICKPKSVLQMHAGWASLATTTTTTTPAVPSITMGRTNSTARRVRGKPGTQNRHRIDQNALNALCCMHTNMSDRLERRANVSAGPGRPASECEQRATAQRDTASMGKRERSQQRNGYADWNR